jgi:hypothetical protein
MSIENLLFIFFIFYILIGLWVASIVNIFLNLFLEYMDDLATLIIMGVIYALIIITMIAIIVVS